MQTSATANDDLTSSLSKMNLNDVPQNLRCEFPGANTKTQEKTLDLLKKNDLNFDIFFTESGLHNHLVHHILAAYAFGASPERLTKIYENHAGYQRARKPPQITITEENWTEHLGRNELWSDYLTFFQGVVQKDGIIKTFEKYGFHPALFARNFGGAFHPIIHIGYGIEFQLPLILAEGLAQAAVHENKMSELLTKEFLEHNGAEKRTIFQIIEDVSKDDRLQNYLTYEEKNKNTKLLKEKPEVVREHAQKWVITPTEDGVREATKELYHAIALIYGATAVRPDKSSVRLEFFLMHGVTSMLFIYLMLPHVSLKRRIELLKAEFVTVLTYYISRGSPKLHIDTLKNYKPHDLVEEPNPWLDVINKALLEEEDAHVIKTIRSLYKAEQEIGPEKDGLYLKIAQLTMEQYKIRDWSRNGIGWEEEWEEKTHE